MTTSDLLKYKHGLYLLTCVCGLIDITCFMVLNGVFADMMTGNLIMISVSIGTAHRLDSSAKFASAIISFLVGVMIGALVLKRTRHSNQAVIGYMLVWCALFVALVVPFIAPDVASAHHGKFLVGSLCAAMGIHSAIIRIHGLPDLATNLMTMTLTSFVTETILLGRAHDRWRRRLLSIGLFVTSAILCAFLIKHVAPYAGLALALLLLTIAIPCLAQEKPS
ncbi:MAG: YoaK family protein [Fluviibacter sp.]